MQEKLGEYFDAKYFGKFRKFMHGTVRLIEVHLIYEDDSGVQYRISKGIGVSEDKSDDA